MNAVWTGTCAKSEGGGGRGRGAYGCIELYVTCTCMCRCKPDTEIIELYVPVGMCIVNHAPLLGT